MNMTIIMGIKPVWWGKSLKVIFGRPNETEIGKEH